MVKITARHQKFLATEDGSCYNKGDKNRKYKMNPPIGMMYRATSANATWQIFWYEKNLQGDVVAVYSHDGVKLVSYAYDAWGNTTTTYHNGGASTGARYNPIRYRSYYYDTDLDMYWLQTRLYNPTLRRFMSPDSFVSTGTGILGYNMYAYCNNDPVNNVDYTGNSLVAVIVIALLCGTAAATLSSCGSQPTSDVGAAQPYVDMPGSNDSTSPNCYSYAIGSSINEQPGGTSGRIPEK